MESFFEDIVASNTKCEGCNIVGNYEDDLVTFVKDKTCSNGDLFSGFINMVTGDLVSGKRIYVATQECYEGVFLNGERHGKGTLVKLNGEGKFIGRFENDFYSKGTLITQAYTYIGDFRDGLFHGRGTLMYEDGSVYEGMFERGLFSGDGRFSTSSGESYEGAFLEGMKHGHGRITYDDGSIYVGDWKKDCRDGVGRLSKDSVQIYEGEFANDKRHGNGILLRSAVVVIGPWRHDKPLDGPSWTIRYPKTGVEYSGDAVSCRPHGCGTLSFRSDGKEGHVYEGQVLCGLRHGLGRLVTHEDKQAIWKCDTIISTRCDLSESATSSCETATQELDTSDCPSNSNVAHLSEDGDAETKHYPNGDSFRGHVDQFGRHQGFGVFFEAATGMSIRCNWKNSKKHGMGVLDQPLSGVKYLGSFVDDVMQGKGSIRFPDGSTYTGTLVDGMMHGKGIFYDATNDSFYSGDFFHSLKHGHGEEELADGSIYVGPFLNGMRSGDDGSVYQTISRGRRLVSVGQWHHGEMTGHGKLFEVQKPQAGSYCGELRDGKRHGLGKFTSNTGVTFEGKWLDGTPCDGEWTIMLPKRSIYCGSALVEFGVPVADGFGSEMLTDGSFYTGGFRSGKRHGNGLCVFKSGEKWDGRWDDGVFVKYGRSRPHD